MSGKTGNGTKKTAKKGSSAKGSSAKGSSSKKITKANERYCDKPQNPVNIRSTMRKLDCSLQDSFDRVQVIEEKIQKERERRNQQRAASSAAKKQQFDVTLDAIVTSAGPSIYPGSGSHGGSGAFWEKLKHEVLEKCRECVVVVVVVVAVIDASLVWLVEMNYVISRSCWVTLAMKYLEVNTRDVLCYKEDVSCARCLFYVFLSIWRKWRFWLASGSKYKIFGWNNSKRRGIHVQTNEYERELASSRERETVIVGSMEWVWLVILVFKRFAVPYWHNRI